MPTTMPFLAESPACVYDSFTLTTFIERSHLLTILSTLAPTPSDSSGYALASRFEHLFF